jgi:hypothetical protein
MTNTNITDALNDIELQVGTLAQSVVDLRTLVERAGIIPTTTTSIGARLKLHEAMAVALRQRGNKWTKISDLADMINAQQLYAKGDGSPVESNQLHARANRPTYQPMFEKNGPMIRLRVDWAR